MIHDIPRLILNSKTNEMLQMKQVADGLNNDNLCGSEGGEG